MKFVLGLLAAALATGLAFGQLAGGGAGQGRGGGISYVTRRLPTSTAGGSAAALFSAGGVSGMTAGSTVVAGAVGANVGATGIVQRPAAANGRALTALRQLAATGDKEAQRMLRNPALVAQLANTR